MFHKMRIQFKAVILGGGQGTRISEETHLKPKPLIEIPRINSNGFLEL